MYPWFTKEETEAQDSSVTYPRSPEKLELEFQPEWVPESTWITNSNSGVGVGTCSAYVPAVEKSIGGRVLILGVYLMRFSYENILISSGICRTVWKAGVPLPGPLSLVSRRTRRRRRSQAWGLCSQVDEARGRLGTKPHLKMPAARHWNRSQVVFWIGVARAQELQQPGREPGRAGRPR